MFIQLKTLLLPALLAVMVLGCSEQPNPDLATAKAKAEHCAISDDVNYVRKTHMDAILHQRDKTVHDGIRTSKHSLKACINCHVPKEKKGKAVRISDTANHFCATCHNYAAVKLDCFECHSDRPESAALVKGDNPHE